VRDDDANELHAEWHGGPLLFRAGGYWWDGATWYRPGQIWDAADGDFVRTPARSRSPSPPTNSWTTAPTRTPATF
jgi:hypothetical protein